MVITAKFSSICPKCGAPIAAGAKVEWQKGAKATHATCPAAAAPAARGRTASRSSTPRASTPSVEAAPYVRGRREEPCKRIALPDYTSDVMIVGKTSRPWAQVRDGATADALVEGDAVVVVGQTAQYVSQDDSEDFGDMSGAHWMLTLYLRRATEAEAAPARERAARAKAAAEAKAAREAMIAELRNLASAGMHASDGAAKRPQGRSVELHPGVHGSGRIEAILSPDEGAVAVWYGGYYDDYRETLNITRDPRAVEIMRALLG